MAPEDGLVHLKEYDIKDSNVELIGSDLDHKVKYNSAASEPAWNDGQVGVAPGLHIWRIEDFEVIPWPKDKYGLFYDGDSFIVLHSYKVGQQAEADKLGHDIFFWLGSHTSQDEAGVAAYKTVELDEFLHGKASQHREIQESPSDAFMELFPKIQIRSGGVRSGFRHVEEEAKEEVLTLLRVFKHPGSKRDSVVVYEVEPTWQSLDEDDVFILDKGDKIFVWQGKNCSPMEKAKSAQVVHDMTLAKHIDVEVLSQTESRSRVVVEMLGRDKDAAPASESYRKPKPFASRSAAEGGAGGARGKKLFKLSDASGQLSFGLVKEGASIGRSDLDGSDVFILDDAGKTIWVWQGAGASRAEKAAWLKVAQAYVRQLQGGDDQSAHLTPIAKVVDGSESPAFMRAIAV
ncbi:actin depolymerizing protein [Cryphonectria parasitica EP155]|uniref:Actin depolymerizing protein n=1 Tax=Cryphonectria parasitica (strain ATCC 38755 / EP155) TaxID=660469 RepID=A0A9P5CNK3_CRYP1|nr:actin depolymerizing protein [Cryphonectria parasitica EP155]KAF3765559.1 actin depolymerizing protein [Cryphonectria parasitica EP155]